MATFWAGTRIGRLAGPDALTLKHLFAKIGDAFDRMAERPLDQFGTPEQPLELPEGVDIGGVEISATAPDPPTGLTVTDDADARGTAITVAWTAPVSGPVPARYEVRVTEVGQVSATVYTTAGLNLRVLVKPLTYYSIAVRSESNVGLRSTALVVMHTSAADTTAPPQVTGVNASGGLRAMVLWWDESPAVDVANGAGLYEFEVYSDAGLGGLVSSDRTDGTVVSTADLTPDTQYWVRVRAVDSSGNVGPWSATVTFTTSLAGTADIAAASIVGSHIQAGTIDASHLTAITLEVGKYVESDNYVAGVSGWRLDDDTAELNDVVVRGDIEIGTADAGPLVVNRDEGIAIPLWNPSGGDGDPFINSIKWYDGLQGPSADYPAGQMYVESAAGNYLDIVANQATTDGTVNGTGIGDAAVSLMARSVGGGTASIRSFVSVGTDDIWYAKPGDADGIQLETRNWHGMGVPPTGTSAAASTAGSTFYCVTAATIYSLSALLTAVSGRTYRLSLVQISGTSISSQLATRTVVAPAGGALALTAALTTPVAVARTGVYAVLLSDTTGAVLNMQLSNLGRDSHTTALGVPGHAAGLYMTSTNPTSGAMSVSGAGNYWTTFCRWSPRS